MLRLSSKIVIGDIGFTGVNSVSIESSWENLTDTCKITIPKNVSWQSKNITQIIKRGDKVSVSIGYNGENIEVFQGYVRDVNEKIPCEIVCEDAMFLLKKGNHDKIYKSVNTERLIKDIVGVTVPYEVVANATLGDYRVKNATAAKVLEHLRSNYFIKSFFRKGTLYVGLAYIKALQRVHQFDFSKNIFPEHSLEYKRKEDVSLSLKGVIMYSNNKKQQVKEGDEYGEQRTFHYYNRPKSEVRKSLKEHLERLKYTGFYGSFTTFGVPQVFHGDIVELHDKKHPERDGKYLVKKVSSNFGSDGYHQTIELESKA